MQSDRLESRLRSKCGTINTRRKELCRSGSKVKRELFLVAESQISVLESEVVNLSDGSSQSISTSEGNATPWPSGSQQPTSNSGPNSTPQSSSTCQPALNSEPALSLEQIQSSQPSRTPEPTPTPKLTQSSELSMDMNSTNYSASTTISTMDPNNSAQTDLANAMSRITSVLSEHGQDLDAGANFDSGNTLPVAVPPMPLRKSAPSHVRFADPITFTSAQHGKSNDQRDCNVGVILNMTNRFALDMRDYCMETGNSYVSILNSHIDVFNFVDSERLEARLRNACCKVATKRKKLHYKGSIAQREKHLLALRQVSILKSEILNAADVGFGSFLSPDPVLGTTEHMDVSEDLYEVSSQSPDLETLRMGDLSQMDVVGDYSEIQPDSLDMETSPHHSSHDPGRNEFLINAINIEPNGKSPEKSLDIHTLNETSYVGVKQPGTYPSVEFQSQIEPGTNASNIEPVVKSPEKNIISVPSRVRFEDPITFTSSRLYRTGGQIEDSSIAVVLNMTNRFIQDLFDCHNMAGSSYISVLNSQIRPFDLSESARLQARLKNMCQRVQSQRRDLRKASKAQRESFPHEIKQV